MIGRRTSSIATEWYEAMLFAVTLNPPVDIPVIAWLTESHIGIPAPHRAITLAKVYRRKIHHIVLRVETMLGWIFSPRASA